MRRRMAAAAAAALLFAAGYWSGRVERVWAQTRSQVRDVTVPRSWGNFKGVYYDQLLFEDERGTIRSVYPQGGTVVFAVTRR